MEMYKSIVMTCALGLASSLPVFSADIATLTECARDAMADSNAPSAAPPWEKSLPLLALMPADVQWAVEKKMGPASFVPKGRFAIGCTETQSLVDYYCINISGMALLETIPYMQNLDAMASRPELAEEMKEYEKLKCCGDRAKALLRRIADSGRRFSVGTVYAVAEAPEGGAAGLADLAQNYGKIFRNAAAIKAEDFEYKGWRGYKCDLGQSWKELNRMICERNNVKDLGLGAAQAYYEGTTLYYLYRLEGSRLYMCFCDNPEKIAWATEPSKSILSRPIWQQMPMPAEGEVTHAFVASRKSMQEFSTSAGGVAALLSELDPDEILFNMPIPGKISAFYAAAAPVLSALSGGDLGLVVCKKQTGDYRGVMRATLNEVSFDSGVLRVPQGSSETESVLTFACTPLKLAEGVTAGAAATLPVLLAKGATLLSRSPETDSPHETITNELIPATQQDVATPMQKPTLPADFCGMVFSVEGWNFTKYTTLWANHIGIMANYPPFTADDACLFKSFDAALCAKGGQGFIRFRLTTSGEEDVDPMPLLRRSQDEDDADKADFPADADDEGAQKSESPQGPPVSHSGIKVDLPDELPLEECVARAKRQEPRAVREVVRRYAAAENRREALRWYAFAFYHQIDLYDAEDKGLIMLLSSVNDAESVLRNGGPEERMLLCYCLLEGVGFPKNEEKAFRILEDMARSGDPSGQFHLGIAYYRGEGCERNTQEAIRWLKAAAAQGNADAREVLELMQEDSNQE